MKSVLKQPYNIAIRKLPLSTSLKIQYYRYYRRWPDLSNPTLFSEKLQVRKLAHQDDFMTLMADKVLVKSEVRDTLGEEWVTPTLHSGENLPNYHAVRSFPPFVVKANHGSGWNIFVKNPTEISEWEWESIRARAAVWLKIPYEPHSSGKFYQDIKPQLLIEPLIGNGSPLFDYKLYVFSGVTKYIHVLKEDEEDRQSAFFTPDWKVADFNRASHRLLNMPHPRPASMDMMIEAARKLSKNNPFVRADFYEVHGKPVFGELTFVPASGFARFTPPEADAHLGSLWP